MKFVANLLNEPLLCNELKIKEYKEILKCSFGDEPNELIFIETLCDVFAALTNKKIKYFKNASVVDLLLLLLEVRINSQGDTCKINVTKQGKTMSLELRLDYVLDDIKKIVRSFNKTIKQDNIEIILSCPSAERLLKHQNEEDYLYFITKARIKDNNEFVKSIEIDNNRDAKVLFEKLSPKTSLEIMKQTEIFLTECTKTNFLARYQIEEQILNFIPSVDSLMWYTKLIFNESLEVFYDNLFYLSHLGHISLDYVNNLTPGEYTYMVKKLESVLSSQAHSSTFQEDNYETDENVENGFFETPQ